MSLSVERLKELTNKKIEHMGAYDLAHMKDAIRELIAIKEAEPVGWFDPYESSDGTTSYVHIKKEFCGTNDSVPLIRKPE